MSRAAYQLLLKGRVQGVGFRPFVYRLASRLGITGSVANGPQGVRITAQAEPALLDEFLQALQTDLPPQAQLDQLDCEEIPVDDSRNGFTIEESEEGALSLTVTPDIKVCDACQAELFDPDDRRYHYPFINCTQCGPRYSLIEALPYDRAQTSMLDFEQCSACLAEYDSPTDRRFHAQPNACPDCGPQLSFYRPDAVQEDVVDPVQAALELIRQGKIVAVKGVGGIHLMCDARNATAITRLRKHKQRPDKPLAIMAANTASLRNYVELDPAREQRLQADDAAIGISPLRTDQAERLPAQLAPGLDGLGVMLAYTPLHFLLFHKAAGEPRGLQWLKQAQRLLLVVTSANRPGEPLLADNTEALTELQGIADGFLLHNRRIVQPCDDPVVNFLGTAPVLVRSGRGMAPLRLPLSPALVSSGHSVLALGALLKNTFCLSKACSMHLSTHMGNMDNPQSCRHLQSSVERLTTLLGVKPDMVVSDSHPDFYSSRLAQEYSLQHGIPWLQVQHHHAHIAAVLAEHQLTEPVLGVALDGFGLGEGDALWGGELLYVADGTYQHLSGFRPIRLPGGDRAAREPWRVAAGVLTQLQRLPELEQRFSHQPAIATVRQQLQGGFNCPGTSSAGRMFDAAAALLGVVEVCSYEAQAAMMLESCARRFLRDQYWPNEEQLIRQRDGELDLLPLFERLCRCEDKDYGAALFHEQLISGLSDWIVSYAQTKGLTTIVLAGGCFLNTLLLDGLSTALQQQGLQVYYPQVLPPNDAAIAVGQVQVALALAAQLSDTSPGESLCV